MGSIDVIVYEQTHHRGGAATACCVGLVAAVQAFAAEHGIELMAVHTGELKRWATGKGNAGKPQMIEGARAKGWAPVDDNEADAALLLGYAAESLGLKMGQQPSCHGPGPSWAGGSRGFAQHPSRQLCNTFLIQIGKRMAAANTILAGMNRQDVFRANTLRNQAFWSTRVPLMQNYDPRTMEKTIFQYSQAIADQVQNEILK